MGQLSPLKVKGNPMGLSKMPPGLVARDAQERLGAFLTCPCPPHPMAKVAICSRSLLSAALMQSSVICPGIYSRRQDSS